MAEACKETMETVALKMKELYTLRNTFFPGDAVVKKERLEMQIKEVLALLDGVRTERRRPASQRALWEYFRGKALDAAADYSKEAEEHLAKAVKLDPSLEDAWLCLGNCFWKKGDLPAAKNCFTHVLSNGPNVKALLELSTLERRMAQGTGEEAQKVEESINLAKQAVALDVTAGQSWYTLGNAYLTSFFVTVGCDLKKLHLSLKAYQNAEKHEATKANPDLHFNSAIVHEYLEDYERALRGYESASSTDPGLHADAEIEKVLKLLAKLTEQAANKGGIKPRRLSSLLSEGIVTGSIQPLKLVTVQALQEGVNRGVAVATKVLAAITYKQRIPLFYLLVDRKGSCVILSVYALRSGAIKEHSSVTLLEPHFRNVSVSWKQHTFGYPAIRVDHPQQLLVNGRPPRVADATVSKIHAQHVPP